MVSFLIYHNGEKVNQYSVEEIVAQYETSGRISEETLRTGDSRRGNRERKNLIRFFKLFEKDRELARACISRLYQSECASVRITAAAYCLSLGIHVPKAEAVLYEISQDESLGIVGFNAEMTLKVWKKQGWLKIYPEQQIEGTTETAL
ncbi:MAG: hypothetical protein J5789_05950 [Oscillospiraceae bacterium]|nr:hypothetical protein [Oscillospiraceae bacterium]